MDACASQHEPYTRDKLFRLISLSSHILGDILSLVPQELQKCSNFEYTSLCACVDESKPRVRAHLADLLPTLHC